MATITMQGLDEYADKIKALGMGIEGVCKYAIYPAAGIVIEAIKENTPVDSGDLRDSTSLSVMRNDNGFIYTKVTWTGYDSKGVPNAIKANVLESGSSTRQKHPFVRPAVNKSKKAAEFAMEMYFNEKCNEIMK